MTDEKYTLRQHLVRGGTGGAALILFVAARPQFAELFLRGQSLAPVSYIFIFALGALAGIATMPFADGGAELVVRSSVHFALTAAAFTALCCVNGITDALILLALNGFVAAFYLTVWLARWIAWFGEISDIREKLGIAPKASPLGTVEALPYSVLVLLTSLIVSCAGYALDRSGWIGSIMTALIIPAGVFWAGAVLGKHNGFAPAYIVLAEIAAAAGFGITIFALRLNLGFGWAAVLPAAAALLGNGAGALLRKINKRRAK